jgi:hypothetical protein
LNEIDIGFYSCRMIVIYIICMLIHETGHYFVGKKYHYKVIMLQFFGFKIKRQGNKWNISFRISEIFSGCVMFD